MVSLGFCAVCSKGLPYPCYPSFYLLTTSSLRELVLDLISVLSFVSMSKSSSLLRISIVSTRRIAPEAQLRTPPFERLPIVVFNEYFPVILLLSSATLTQSLVRS